MLAFPSYINISMSVYLWGFTFQKRGYLSCEHVLVATYAAL